MFGREDDEDDDDVPFDKAQLKFWEKCFVASLAAGRDVPESAVNAEEAIKKRAQKVKELE